MKNNVKYMSRMTYNNLQNIINTIIANIVNYYTKDNKSLKKKT